MGLPLRLDSPTQRMRALLAQRFRRIRERAFAQRLCRDAVQALGAVRTAQPELRGEELHEAVLERWLPVDGLAPRVILRRTRSSIEGWGTEREPRFTDVVSYVIVTEYLKQDAEVSGMNMDLAAFLARRIDRRL